jgi:hypothetical protein
MNYSLFYLTNGFVALMPLLLRVNQMSQQKELDSLALVLFYFIAFLLISLKYRMKTQVKICVVQVVTMGLLNISMLKLSPLSPVLTANFTVFTLLLYFIQSSKKV